MIGSRHRVPTHLNVEDKAILGLTLREVACLGLGALCGFAVYGQLAGAPLPFRLLASFFCFAAGLGLAFARPLGRGLEEWAFVLLHFLATPRRAIWSPRPPDPAGWTGRDGDWAPAAVRITGGRGAASPSGRPVAPSSERSGDGAGDEEVR